MRFPRNAKIFRGQIDAAPFAGLFFMLLLMLLLYGNSIFIPGIRVQLRDQTTPELEERTLTVEASGRVTYLGERYEVERFEERLRLQAQAGRLPSRVRYIVEPKASAALVTRVEQFTRELGIALRPPGRRLEVPPSAGFPGVRNPTVVVGINLNGQIFVQQRLVPEESLVARLKVIAENEPMATLVLQADRAVPLDRITRLMGMARSAGFAEVLLAQGPG